jgi:hypothetical protein
MARRCAALFFILAMAGHAAAGVCRCVGGATKSVHSCCKRQKPASDSMRRTMCCDTDCVVRSGDSAPQTRAEAAVKLTLKADAAPLTQQRWSPMLVRSTQPAIVTTFSDQRFKFARPPELYLRNHAFLI